MEKQYSKWYVTSLKVLLSAIFIAAFIFMSCGKFTATVHASGSYSKCYRVSGTENYLALRTKPAYEKKNEIGKLYNGDTVWLLDFGEGNYWYVSTAIGDGYVNKNYLVPVSNSSDASSDSWNTLRVAGTKNYLALRSARSSDSSNEIGKLHNNDTAILVRFDESQYWLIYAPSVGKFGYVNKDYLVNQYGGEFYGFADDMYVAAGMNNYLALRSGMSSNSSNEIGKIHHGQPVEYIAAGNGPFCYVYAPTLGKFGYVNGDYLIKVGSGNGNYGNFYPKYKVQGTKQYLALRKARNYDSSNEIGKLKNGQTVEYVESADSTYWFVYAPTLGKFGYVNKNYLTK